MIDQLASGKVCSSSNRKMMMEGLSHKTPCHPGHAAAKRSAP